MYCDDLQRIAFCPSCAMPTMGIAHRAARVASFLNCRGAGVDGDGVLRAVDGRVNFRATTVVELTALSLAVSTAITGPPEIRDLPRWVAGRLACGHVLALDLARGAVDALEPVLEVVLVSPVHGARLPQVGSAALRHCAFPTSRTRFAPVVGVGPLPRRTHRALAIHISHTNFAGRAALAVWHRHHLLVVAVIGRSGRVMLAVVALRMPFIVHVLAQCAERASGVALALGEASQSAFQARRILAAPEHGSPTLRLVRASRARCAVEANTAVPSTVAVVVLASRAIAARARHRIEHHGRPAVDAIAALLRARWEEHARGAHARRARIVRVCCRELPGGARYACRAVAACNASGVALDTPRRALCARKPASGTISAVPGVASVGGILARWAIGT